MHVQTYMANKTFTQKIRGIMNQISENVSLHENAKNITLKLEGIHPCLHISSVLKQNFSRPLFWGFTNAQQTWKWAQNTKLP